MLLLTALDFPKVSANTINGITFEKSLPAHQIHEYKFTNKLEGNLKVNISEESEVFHSIFNIADENITYQSDDVLPVGDYKIVISPMGLVSNDYRIELTGDVNIVGENTIPNINIENPIEDEAYVDEGVFSFNYTGSTDGILNSFTLNRGQPITIANNFSESLTLLFGRNILSMYSELTNQNSVTDIRSVTSPGVQRLSGASRYDTAVNISQEIEKEGMDINTVILTNGSSFPDGLPATVLAYKETAPILTTHTEALPAVTKDEIVRLGVENVIILGGNGAVSTNVEEELLDMKINVTRLYGLDRYEVSTKVAEKVIDETTNSIVIANGSSYPDALSIATFASQNQQPILYTRTDSLPSSVKDFLTANPNITDITIVGGRGAVSEEVERELEQNFSTLRIDGLTRYETNVNINKFFNTQQRSILLTSNEIDGIPSTLLSSLKNSSLLLTSPTSLPAPTQDFTNMAIYDEILDNVYIVGGTGAVSKEIEDKLKSEIR